MSDNSITKVNSKYSPKGDMGQKYLASGKNIAMRMWEKETDTDKPEIAREYETVGYVISGKAELVLEGQSVELNEGDSWVVPAHSKHTYRILEPFVAVEATHPPARIDDRDDPKGR